LSQYARLKIEHMKIDQFVYIKDKMSDCQNYIKNGTLNANNFLCM